MTLFCYFERRTGRLGEQTVLEAGKKAGAKKATKAAKSGSGFAKAPKTSGGLDPEALELLAAAGG